MLLGTLEKLPAQRRYLGAIRKAHYNLDTVISQESPEPIRHSDSTAVENLDRKLRSTVLLKEIPFQGCLGFIKAPELLAGCSSSTLSTYISQ